MGSNFFFKGKSVLVTGASGSIGSELIRQLLKLECRVIRALSNDENGMYHLSNEISSHKKIPLTKKMKKNKIRYLIGDIRDYQRNFEACANIDIVIHAAAMKHVSICEYNPEETIKTNYLGTKKIVKASLIQNVKNFLFISTDKAVCPSSLMGLSKKKAEEFVLNSNKHNKTKFSVIRFGNIIGSRGSVLEAFINQVKTNKRLSVTHNDMTRFFLTISLATKKIIQSINIMKGNEIFLINGMKSFKIYDLAKTVKKISKYKKKILNIGLRAGEKLHEVIAEKKELKNFIINNNLIVINKNNNLKKNITSQIKFDISSDKANHLNCKEIEKYLINDIKILKYLNL